MACGNSRTLSSSNNSTEKYQQRSRVHCARGHPEGMASNAVNGCPSIRVIIQQCLSAKLQVQPPTEDSDAQWVEISRGIIVYLCFLKGSNLDLIPKVVKSILNVKLSEPTGQPSNVSVLDLPGDVLIVPQATLGGKMKGKSIQYHSNISKEEGRLFYEKFVFLCEETIQSSSPSSSVKHGTYGNRQVLSVDTNGPFTHVFDF